jgi:hypothetical protein
MSIFAVVPRFRPSFEGIVFDNGSNGWTSLEKMINGTNLIVENVKQLKNKINRKKLKGPCQYNLVKTFGLSPDYLSKAT